MDGRENGVLGGVPRPGHDELREVPVPNTAGPDLIPGYDPNGPNGLSGAIIATLGNYKGRNVVDIRKYYTRDGERPTPTRKGIAVEVDRLPALAGLVRDALSATRRRGLLPDEGGDA